MNEYYMVKDEIWDRVQGGRGMLCIGCLETRLGRELNFLDFTNAPCNAFFKQSERLQHRLTIFRNISMEPLWTQLEEYTDRSEEEKELLNEIRIRLVRLRSLMRPGPPQFESDREVSELLLNEILGIPK